ncbi:MAG TPA: rhodanese-like domain-containing protein [Candidatus Binataceae bacterium]|nr:rhodanese-like domain-containing protein [Candidatus Binataceae bacterium]
MAIKQKTPRDAHQQLKCAPGATYVDVRTEAEFAAGHPEGAINVPVMFIKSGQRQMNDEFVEIVDKLFERNAPLIVGCLSGGRSQHACELLEEAGFGDLTNVVGGFGGARDQAGNVVAAGWKDEGLPVVVCIEECSYVTVRKKAGV